MAKFLFAFVLAAALTTQAAAAELHLFAGNVYLGCFTCKPTHQSSIWNAKGRFGSATSPVSIWNPAGKYGNAVNVASPWSRRTSSKFVVLVEKSGRFHGYFTCNQQAAKRVSAATMDYLCANHTRLANDLEQGWREVIVR